MPLDAASAARADIVYPRLNVTVDTGGVIDIRNLDDVNGATNDATTKIQAIHTADNSERCFDPAQTQSVVQNVTTLLRIGWAFPVADMTPPDAVSCNAIIKAQTVAINFQVGLTWVTSGAVPVDPAVGTVAPTWRASLWRYKPSDDTGTLIASGSTTTPTWDISATGDPKNTQKTGTISIVIPTGGVEFQTDETLLLQIGLNTGTLPNPLANTTTYTWSLQIDDNDTNVNFGDGVGIRLICIKTDSCTGEGLVSTTKATIASKTFSLIGEGLVSSTKATVASKIFTLIGEGLSSMTRVVVAARIFNLIGEGLVSMTRVVISSKTFTILGEGLVSPATLAITMARTATGEGIVTFTKATTVSKTFNLIGEGLVSMTKNTQAVRTFNLIGEGVVTRQMSPGLARTAVGEGLVTLTKGVIASKTFTILGEGLVTLGRDTAFTFNLIGEGLVTEVHPVSAFRTFDLIGEGLIVITGANTSTITIPIDEVPTGGGGGGDIIIVNKIFGLMRMKR